jgi:hypothetical protein
VSVAAGDLDAAGDVDGDGVELGSPAVALTYIKPISTNKTRVAVINHHRIDESGRNGFAMVFAGRQQIDYTDRLSTYRHRNYLRDNAT